MAPMTDPVAPRTEAGKRLYEGLLRFAPDDPDAVVLARVKAGLLRDILAIEAEASRQPTADSRSVIASTGRSRTVTPNGSIVAARAALEGSGG